MLPPAVRRAALAAVVASLGLVVLLLAAARPAAAHAVEGGSLPAPSWLLAYGSAFAVLICALVLRASWLAPHRVAASQLATVAAERGAAVPPRVGVGHGIGTALFALVLVAAIVGPDSYAANVAPVAVLVVWWVGLPIACLLAGDVMARVNPFQAPTAAVARVAGDRWVRPAEAPTWTAAAFVGAFAWFLLAYHAPGSPRALATFLALYAAAAVAGGLWWGRGWLTQGEGFAGLSAAVAHLSWRRADRRPVAGLAPLMIVLTGATAFDAFASTAFWVDVLGTSQGWERTLLDTVGLVWLTAIVTAVYLLALRAVSRPASGTDEAPGRALVAPLGLALVPLAVGWFLAHDVTLLLVEGQNFIILASDPIGEGWDLFGTVGGWTPDFTIVEDGWVRWLQLLLLLAGHLLTVVIAHDVALRLRRPRRALQLTWAIAILAAASIAAAVLLVLG